MNPPRVTQIGALVTAACAGGLLLLTVVTAMAHEPPMVTTLCAGFAIGAILLTNVQLRMLHDKKARDGESPPPK